MTKINPKCTTITGTRLRADEFVCTEVDSTVDGAHLRALLEGRGGPLLVRRFISPVACRTIATRFVAATGAGQRTDDVQGREVGVGHYGKTIDGYLDRVEATRAEVEGLFDGTAHVPTMIAEALKRAVEPGVTVRPAMHGGRSAACVRASQWQRAGKFILAPHDDKAQCSQAAQRGFEIQEIDSPVSVVVYPSMPEQGGELRLYNMAPDDQTRTLLGISETGHPYPVELLDGIPYIDIRTEAGDALFANGSFLHAVRQCHGTIPRVSLTGFFGLNRRKDVVLLYT